MLLVQQKPKSLDGAGGARRVRPFRHYNGAPFVYWSVDTMWRLRACGRATPVTWLIRIASTAQVHRVLSICVAVAVLAGCDVFGPNEERVIGFVNPSSLTWPPIVLPDTAVASEPLFVTVWTTGGGCTREGDTEVVVTQSTVKITPFDILTHADACLSSEEYFAHEVNLELTDRGPVQVVLRARNIHGGVVVELEREVWVR